MRSWPVHTISIVDGFGRRNAATSRLQRWRQLAAIGTDSAVVHLICYGVSLTIAVAVPVSVPFTVAVAFAVSTRAVLQGQPTADTATCAAPTSADRATRGNPLLLTCTTSIKTTRQCVWGARKRALMRGVTAASMCRPTAVWFQHAVTCCACCFPPSLPIIPCTPNRYVVPAHRLRCTTLSARSRRRWRAV